MGKLRKILALIFASLSAFFAVVALKNSGRERDRQCCEPLCAYEWGADAEAAARRAGRLVFLRSENAPKPQSETADLLKERYVCAEISRDKFPADFAILDNLLQSATNRKLSFEAGIFSPNLAPIYISAKASTADGRLSPNFENALSAAAAKFENNPERLKSGARAAARIADAPSDFALPRDVVGVRGSLGFIDAESARLFIFFNNPRTLGADAAVISENARLASRICGADFRQLGARTASVAAVEMLCTRLASKNADMCSKLLFLRALGESELAAKNGKLGAFFVHCAKGMPAAKRVRDAALSVPVLLRAYELSDKSEFLKRAEDTAAKLAAALPPRGLMPAVFGEKSEASALEYVLCARAFFEMSKLDKKWDGAMRSALDGLDRHFMTDLGVWSVNAKNSAFAKMSRTIFTRDASLPSYVGEAAQLLAETGDTESPAARKLQKLALSAAASAPLTSNQWASLKLSLLPSFDARKRNFAAAQ